MEKYYLNKKFGKKINNKFSFTTRKQKFESLNFILAVEVLVFEA